MTKGSPKQQKTRDHCHGKELLEDLVAMPQWRRSEHLVLQWKAWLSREVCLLLS